jgi:hypothetical protein
MQDRFCVVMTKYCQTISDFVDAIKVPTKHATAIIQDTKKRTSKFDLYVSSVNTLNELVVVLVDQIKAIISSLTRVFVHKTPDTFVDFIIEISKFIDYLITHDVFMKLNIIDTRITKHKMLKGTELIKHVIFKIFNIALEVTIIFIPALSPVKIIVDIIDKFADTATDITNISRKLAMIDVSSHTLKQLMCIDPDGDAIRSNVNIELIQICLRDKTADFLIEQLFKLESEYVDVFQMSIELRREIERYHEREMKQSLLEKICIYIKYKFGRPGGRARRPVSGRYTDRIIAS